MTLFEMWKEAKSSDMPGAFELWVLIDFLVLEKKVLTYEDNANKLDFYYQDRFRDSMNAHINDYMKRNGITNTHKLIAG
ncbi:hypothetical protein [Bacillus sp. BP-3]|uniref:hypothetical protein n=1 Tax=Bacillus sp. BP-3 TaxID=3022773 RepID=UPI0023300D66|nr:hypothetical protein [Bacillus sp. BP-3]MDC2867525.1 hypothetical protein [Bacillus sp. BP-3]